MALQEEFEKQGLWLFRYRGIIPVVVLVIGAVIYLRSITPSSVNLLHQQPYKFYYELFCMAVGLLGLVIRAYTVGHTPPNTSGRNVKQQVADTLNTTGIYSVVRHPLYLGNFFMWLGPALLTANVWFVVIFCMFYWIYYERIMYAEEQFLRKKFGQQYLDWSVKVPPFIPRGKGFVKSSYRFSWKKVLKKEKNGLVALFLIYCGFNVGGELLADSTRFNYIFLGGAAVSFVLYFVLKYLKYRTSVLSENDR